MPERFPAVVPREHQPIILPMPTDQGFIILDSVLRNGLVVFLITFIVFVAYALFRLRKRRQKLSEYFEEHFVSAFSDDSPEQEPPERKHFVPASNRLRTALRALGLAAACGVLSLPVFAFAPFPFLHNFATTHSWRTAPLRLTSISWDRFHEGFSLEAEVWNQTQEPLTVQAKITIWDNNQEVLDELRVPVQPGPLQPGHAGEFKLRYTENSPFLYGYQISFLDSDGAVILHQEGFDVR